MGNGSAPTLWRRRWYNGRGRQHRLRQPVISIGNLAVGGRGKTPLVAYVARLLTAAGERPAILTRGYARRSPDRGVVVVSDGTHVLADFDRSSDEPLMLARDLPGTAVLVARQRVHAGAIAERDLGTTVHLLDDGFQHLQLARDIDIVLVADRDLEDRPLPFGRLREPVEALNAADAIVIDAAGRGDALSRLASSALKSRVTAEAAIFEMRRSLADPVPLEPDNGWRPGRGPVVAVAGLAEPERFRRALEDAGWTIAASLTFPDHHRYTPRDLDRIREVAARAGAPVVTTSKDAIRLLPFRPLPVSIAAIPLRIDLEPAAAFQTWLLSRLREVRRARA